MELLNVFEAEIRVASQLHPDPPIKPKLKRLDKLNLILAHRPWTVNRHHIKVR